MAYVSANVDIELSDIDTDDLVEEICLRIQGSTKPLSNKQIKTLKLEFQKLENSLFGLGETININNLEDRIKYEHLASVWHKYSSSQMQNLLP